LGGGIICKGFIRMSVRLVPVLALLLASCAAWESSSPDYTPPPVDGPAPSHYAPPPPGDPREPTEVPPIVAPPATNAKVAIASVQLLEDCPDPVPAAAAPSPSMPAAAGVTAPSVRQQSEQKPQSSMQKRSAGDTADGAPFRRMCSQSTVQLSVSCDVAGQFRIEAVRVLAARSGKVAGPAKLRLPTTWSDANGTYAPWDERTVAGSELKISYKLGDPDFSQASALVGDDFNTFGGPFILELDVSVDGKRQTIRSAEFTREPPHVMVT
jgi:hypothetical protein